MGQVNKIAGKYKTHNEVMAELNHKKRIAEMKLEERKLKWQIVRLSLPFRFHIKFNKLIVLFCIVAIVSYTIAAILLQKYIGVEVSPTLTTCVFAFFGTELMGLAGIKMMDTKFSTVQTNVDSDAVG